VERNGQPPSAEEERKQKEKLDKLRRETPEQRAERIRKQEEENTSLVREVPKAFDFVFAGVALDGATLRPDKGSNAELYRNKHTNAQIVMGNTTAPDSASELRADLTKYSARKE
jgi:lipid-binding SYLF domain-containing protein